MIPTLLHAQGAGGQPGGAPSFLISMLPMLLILGVFYFIMIMPMRKKQKALQNLLDALKSGDRVVTTGGIFGTVVGVSGDIVQLKISSNVKIDIAKSGIAGLAPEHKESD